MADRIIASGDARPITPLSEPREFLTTGENLCRLSRAPEVASLHFNPAAPVSSLLGLAIARASGAAGITEVVLELTLPYNATLALQAVRDLIEEVQTVLDELQKRDGKRSEGVEK